MKVFTLDYATWRSGGDGPNKVGEGETKLRNPEGYECCLGQAVCQFKREINKDSLIGRATPALLRLEIPFLTSFSDYFYGSYKNTIFSEEAMEINDHEFIPIEERIKKLRQLFKDHGILMRVINNPFRKSRARAK